MAPFVQPNSIEPTWRRIGGSSPAAILQLQKSSGKRQPEIVGFVLGFTADMSPDVVGLALYVMLVVIEMFRTSGARKIVKVRESTIMRHWHANESLLGELRTKAAELAAAIKAAEESVEPHALRYVIEALTEGDPDDPVPLSADEAWHLFAVLKTAIDSLHDGCRA